MREAFLAVVMLVVSGCTSGSRPVGDGGTGSCSPPCTGGQMCCAESGRQACVNIMANPRHCGGCGRMCAGTCSAGMCMGTDGGPGFDGGEPPGMCMPTCSSSQRCCGTMCANRLPPAGTDPRTDSSFSHCGGCNMPCDPMRATACATPAGGGMGQMCMCGTTLQCLSGRTCVMSGSGFACVDLMTDPMNCGEVGRRCAMGETCSGGMCRCGGGAPCPTGRSCCTGSCIDTTSDPMNCGMCGMVCNAQGPTCRDSMCRCGDSPACPAPMAMGVPPTLGSSCCGAPGMEACVPNSNESCACEMCVGDEMCTAPFPFPGLPPPPGGVCCSEDPFGFSCGGIMPPPPPP